MPIRQHQSEFTIDRTGEKADEKAYLVIDRVAQFLGLNFALQSNPPDILSLLVQLLTHILTAIACLSLPKRLGLKRRTNL